MQMMPRFLENKEWYKEIEEDNGDIRFIPTEKTPKDVLPSFEELYSPPDLTDDEGNNLLPKGWCCCA